jgi:hypothetical protein
VLPQPKSTSCLGKECITRYRNFRDPDIIDSAANRPMLSILPRFIFISGGKRRHDSDMNAPFKGLALH